MSDLPVAPHGDDVHAHPRHTGHRWFDVILAVTAIFISMVSLYVAVEHGRTERDLVAANSWPFPQVYETDDDDRVAFGVTNAGTGPAKIYSVQVALDGVPVSSPAELLRRCCGAPPSEAGWKRAFSDGALGMSSIDYSVQRPGERTDMLAVDRRRSNAEIVDRLGKALRRLSFTTCYCSVLDECWEGSLRSLNAHRVELCAPPAHPYRYSDRPPAAPVAAYPSGRKSGTER